MLAQPRPTLSRNRMSYICTKGLQNAPGENNCFLNCAVQVFWNLDIFRRSFRILSGHACLGHSCIFCALKVIFTQFQYSDHRVLPPNSLRKALAESFADQQRFQLGLMDDAAECFENILTRLHFHIANAEKDDTCRAPHCLPHRKFSLAIREQICCPCGAETEPFPYNQMVLYVSAKSLSSHAQKWMEEERNFFDPSERFSELLGRAHSAEDMRDCPKNCGQKSKIRRHLVNNPDIVSLGLIWETDRPSFDYILDVSETIGTTLKLDDIYDGLVTDHVRETEYHLMGLVCYYGKHYSTFMRSSKSGTWMYFDDAAVQEIGRNFQDVIDKCCKSRYLPLLLFYGNPNGTVVDTSTAPSETTPVPGYTQRPKNHDRTSSSELDLSEGADQPVRRAVTPTPFLKSGGQSPRDPDRARRAVTPGPETRDRKHRARDRDRSEKRPRDGSNKRDGSKSRGLKNEHSRQGSFLIAVSGVTTTEIDIEDSDSSSRSRRRGRSSRHSSNVSQMSRISDASKNSDASRGSDQTDGPPPPYEVHRPGKISLVKDKVQRAAVAAVQRQNSNASTASSATKRQKADSVSSDTDSYLAQDNSNKSSPSHRMNNMAMLNKASMLQRKESFKKGKDKKVHADVIRFVRPPSEASDDGPPTPNCPKSQSSDDIKSQAKPEFWRAKSMDANLHQNVHRADMQQQMSDPTGQRSAQGGGQYPREEIYRRPQIRSQYQGPRAVPAGMVKAQPAQPPVVPYQQYPTPQVPSRQQSVPARPQRTLDDSYMMHGGGTYVDNGFASLPRKRKTHTYVNQNELANLHEESSNPTKPVMNQSQNPSYINRKAVESIMKMQGQNAIAYKMRNTQAKNQQNPLKVNLEIASQDSRDSGYRSGNGTSPSWSGTSGGTSSSNEPNSGFPDPPSPEQLAMVSAEATRTDFAKPNPAQHQQQYATVRQLRTQITHSHHELRNSQDVRPSAHQSNNYEERRNSSASQTGHPNNHHEERRNSSASQIQRHQHDVRAPEVVRSPRQQDVRGSMHPDRKSNLRSSQEGLIYSQGNSNLQEGRSYSQGGSRWQGQSPRSEESEPSPRYNQQRQQSHQQHQHRHHQPQQQQQQHHQPQQQHQQQQQQQLQQQQPSSVLSPDHTPQASMANSDGESECAVLCGQAEDLVRQSLQREEEGDIHRAILYCTQAMVSLKQAMDIPYVDYQSYIRAQMKHNTCIIRNKSLHKRLSSVDSSDGTISGGRSSASETNGSTDSLSGRKSRSRSHSASASLQNLTDLHDALPPPDAPRDPRSPRDGAHRTLPRHVRQQSLSGDETPAQKPALSVKPSVKALKNKNSDLVKPPPVEKSYDIYGTLPRKPKNKLSSSVSVPENLHTAEEVVMRGVRKHPPPPPVRRSSLVNEEGAEAVNEATRNFENQQQTAPLTGPAPSGARHGAPCGSRQLAPPGVSHGRQASELSEFSLPPYPEVDQNEYMYQQQPELCVPLDTRWAVPPNDPGFCWRCHSNQYWIPETSTCLRCDVQKKPPKSAEQDRYQHRLPYNQYTVQYVTTNGNPAVDPHDKHDMEYHSPDKSQYGSSHGSHGAFSPDEGIGLSSSDNTRQESTTDSDMSENKRSVLELALRFDQSKLARLNQPKNLQTFTQPPKLPKSVSFSSELEDKPEERVQKMGYDSDYDEDTSDSCASGSASPYRCGLCQKRKVEPPVVYCRDCSNYMTRFQPAQCQPVQKPGKPAPPAKVKGKYAGHVKTV